MAGFSFKPNRAYPSLPTISGDVASHARALEAMKEAMAIYERRTRNYLDSFVRVGELVDLGLISLNGDTFSSPGSIDWSSITDADEHAQDAVGSILVDSAEIDFTYTDATPSITASLINGSVVFARLQNFDALSVLGRSANSAGVGDEIAAGANDRLLRRTSDTLNFGQLTAGMFPNAVVPDAALSSNVPLLNSDPQSFAGQSNFAKQHRITGWSPPATGAAALELGFVGGFATIFGYNRTTAASTPMQFVASAMTISDTAGAMTSLTVDATAFTVNGLDLASGAAVSLLGRSANSAGARADITASANDRLLRRTSDTLNFGQLTAGMFPNTVVPDAALSANVPLLDAANTFTVNSSGSVSQQFGNSNSGAAAYSNLRIFNDAARQLVLSMTSSGFSGAFLGGSGAPTGEQNAIWTTGSVPIVLGIAGNYIGQLTAAAWISNLPIRLKSYTVATLPAGTQGDTAYVTDALAPAFLTAVVGGGAVVTPVFYDGTNWVAI